MTVFDFAPTARKLVTSATPASLTFTPTVPHGESLTGARFLLLCASGGDITAVSVAASIDGTSFGPERALTTGLPLAATESATVEISDTAAASYRFTITAASAGVARITFLDEPTALRIITTLRVNGTFDP